MSTYDDNEPSISDHEDDLVPDREAGQGQSLIDEADADTSNLDGERSSFESADTQQSE